MSLSYSEPRLPPLTPRRKQTVKGVFQVSGGKYEITVSQVILQVMSQSSVNVCVCVCEIEVNMKDCKMFRNLP